MNSSTSSKRLLPYTILMTIILSFFFLMIDQMRAQNVFTDESGFNLFFSQDKVQVQISKPMYQDQIGYSKSKNSNHYVIISARVINVGNVTHHANPLLFTLIDMNERSYSLDSAAFDIAVLGNEFPAVDLQPNSNAEGVLVFQTPKDITPGKIVYSPMLGQEIIVDILHD